MDGTDNAQLVWRKATASANSGANCVEVAIGDDTVFVRNSRDRSGAALVFTAVEWDAFQAGVRSGEFDRADSPGSGESGDGGS